MVRLSRTCGDKQNLSFIGNREQGIGNREESVTLDTVLHIMSKEPELENRVTIKKAEKVGVDVGINALATCSDGTVFPNPKAYRKAKRKLSRLQRKVSKKVKGSSNRKKAVAKLGIAHKRVSDIRKDNLHKITTSLAKNHSQVVIEDLNVSGMMKNHRLASAIADCGFFEFKRQLTYKCDWYGSELITVDRWYPSSQICSSCGNRQKMPLKERVYNCPSCKASLDRDLNASINLANFGSTASSVETCKNKACGEVEPIESTTLKTSMKHRSKLQTYTVKSF